MKFNFLRPSGIILFLTSLLINSSCNQSVFQPSIEPPPVDTPIWNDFSLDEILGILYDISDNELYTSVTTYKENPQFYVGDSPLEITSVKRYLYFGSLITLVHQFDNWDTFFIHSDQDLAISGIATGSRTFDKSGQLLAEALFKEVIKGKGIVILEIHYNPDGSIKFWCKSQIDFSGNKTAETEVHGTKQTEYYFVWASSTNAP